MIKSFCRSKANPPENRGLFVAFAHVLFTTVCYRRQK